MADEIAIRTVPDTLDILTTRLESALAGCEVIQRSGMLPRHLATPGAVLAVVLRGRELGMGAMEACAAIHFVEGRTVLDASAQLARAIERGVAIEWGEHTDRIAVVTLHRGGRKYVSTYTIAMAQRAGLAGKKVWQAHPEAMLRARAITSGIRAFCPDALGSGGAVYSQDEAEEIAAESAPRREPEHIDVEVVPVEAPKPPTWRDEPIAAEGHDPEFAAGGNRRLGAALGELGIPMDGLSAWLTSEAGQRFAAYIGRGRVSAMGPLRRAELVRVLGAKTAMREAIASWIAAEAAEPAPREPGDEPAETDDVPF